ncbi:MAG: type II toxin-antitoxin system MqsA family antitoxin [Desulfitobacterium hafniense]|nr:type II toxin-antitoxin system MqsA family antitoxin [Desulfitobacterium hafniense]
MKCVFCGKDLAKNHETIERRIKGRLYYVKNVPADVCKFCGEVYIDDEVVSSINKALEKERQNELTGTEVVDFRELSGLSNNHSETPNKKLALI